MSLKQYIGEMKKEERQAILLLERMILESKMECLKVITLNHPKDYDDTIIKSRINQLEGKVNSINYSKKIEKINDANLIYLRNGTEKTIHMINHLIRVVCSSTVLLDNIYKIIINLESLKYDEKNKIHNLQEKLMEDSLDLIEETEKYRNWINSLENLEDIWLESSPSLLKGEKE